MGPYIPTYVVQGLDVCVCVCAHTWMRKRERRFIVIIWWKRIEFWNVLSTLSLCWTKRASNDYVILTVLPFLLFIPHFLHPFALVDLLSFAIQYVWQVSHFHLPPPVHPSCFSLILLTSLFWLLNNKSYVVPHSFCYNYFCLWGTM